MHFLEFLPAPGRAQQRVDARSSALAEHSLVVFANDALHKDRTIPKGTKGTIVAVYKNGKYFEVEITAPDHAVVSASLADLCQDADS